MTTKYIRAAGGASNVASTYELTPGGGETTTVPTSADTVIGHSTSGNLSVAATLACQGLDLNAYTGTVSGSSTINIGGSASAVGNVALRIGTSTTWSYTGTISFVATTATQQTITTSGKPLASTIAFNGAGGSWKCSDSFTTSGTINHTAGSLDTNGQSVTVGGYSSTGTTTRALTAGASTITVTNTGTSWTIIGSNFTYSLASSTLSFTGISGGRALTSTGITYGTLTDSGGTGVFTIAGSNNVFGTLTIATTLRQYQFLIQGNHTINAAALTGSSAVARMLVASATTGTPVTLTVNSWTAISNVDLRDITAAGTANWNLSSIAGGSGDCGGNTGITFTAPTTQYWVGATTAGNWADVTRWTSRVPLPQDNAVINLAFSSGIVITIDMPRIGKNVDFSGATWTGTALSINKSFALTVFGDLILADGMTHTNAVTITAEWREPHRLYMANTSVPAGIVYSMPTKQITNAGAMMAQVGFNGGLSG